MSLKNAPALPLGLFIFSPSGKHGEKLWLDSVLFAIDTRGAFAILILRFGSGTGRGLLAKELCTDQDKRWGRGKIPTHPKG